MNEDDDPTVRLPRPAVPMPPQSPSTAHRQDAASASRRETGVAPRPDAAPFESGRTGAERRQVAGPNSVPGSGQERRLILLAAGATAAVGLAAGAAWWLWPDGSRSPPADPPAMPPRPAAIPVTAPPLLDTQALLAQAAAIPTAMRWASNPLVWVLGFPDLRSQGRAMNRAAALLEKAHTPRDRVLDDAALAAAIATDRRTEESWYFGQNYRASELARFLTLAARDGVTLNPLEAWLAEQVALSRQVEPGRDAAFITLPALGPQVDGTLRAAILRHELGHGQFFTMPLFAAHVMRVWAQGFTEADRSDFRRFLAAEGYDPALDEVMANEAMAYLLYTEDRRFFDPARDLGWPDTRADVLRALLRQGAPPEP